LLRESERGAHLKVKERGATLRGGGRTLNKKRKDPEHVGLKREGRGERERQRLHQRKSKKARLVGGKKKALVLCET